MLNSRFTKCMISNPLISICIPAFKNTDFLARLLDSITIQRFRDFEVVVTDDSPDEAVGALCRDYETRIPLRYYRNDRQLGTPENWNEGVRKASGQWIKIMHDDDWFSDDGSLEKFAMAVVMHPEAGLIFSAYRDVFLDEGRERLMFVPKRRYRAFLRDPAVLFSRNIIGPPSVVMFRRSLPVQFDRAVKWVVDIDFYIRALAGKMKPYYIGEVLINVGLGRQQVTMDCKRQRVVEIPENFYLLNKVGYAALGNVLVYDAWWRLMRNLEIRQREDITEAGYEGPVPPVILSMVRWQRLLPFRFWRMGFLSKTAMLLHYLVHRNNIAA
jgi:glycosyltransferase involved in cell wall biosynthesis